MKFEQLAIAAILPAKNTKWKDKKYQMETQEIQNGKIRQQKFVQLVIAAIAATKIQNGNYIQDKKRKSTTIETVIAIKNAK